MAINNYKYACNIVEIFVATRREKYSNVLQTHTAIVGQVRILVFLFRYS